MNGYPDRPPVRVGTIIGDLAASLYAAIGTLAALREAERTGKGQVVDISQQDSVLTLTENAVVRYTTQGRSRLAARQRPSLRPPLRPVPVQGRLRLLRRLHGQVLARSPARCSASRTRPTIPRSTRWRSASTRTSPKTQVKPLLERWFAAYTKAELEEMAGDRIPLSAIKTDRRSGGGPAHRRAQHDRQRSDRRQAGRHVRPADQAFRTPGNAVRQGARAGRAQRLRPVGPRRLRRQDESTSSRPAGAI